MWVFLAFLSALCLGFYDISKKVALRDNAVVDVLTASVLVSSGILVVPLLISRCMPDALSDNLLYVPAMDLKGHLLTILKSAIVLSSWICSYVALKHLPISIVSPWQATRPMWTLIGALLIFGERLNEWQWIGVALAIGSIFVFSFFNRPAGLSPKKGLKGLTHQPETKYYIALALAIVTGACSGLYDKYIMRLYDHNAVQVYYTLYQAAMMLIFCYIHHKRHPSEIGFHITNIWPVVLISIFLVVSDNVYMLALQDPGSMIAVVSTIRRGGTVIGFGYGLIFLKEKDPVKKILCMIGIITGLICLAMGSI